MTNAVDFTVIPICLEREEAQQAAEQLELALDKEKQDNSRSKNAAGEKEVCRTC